MADLGGLVSMINCYMQPENLIPLVRSAYANGIPIIVDDIRALGRVSRFLRTDSALIKSLVMLATANGSSHSEGLYAHYRCNKAIRLTPVICQLMEAHFWMIFREAEFSAFVMTLQGGLSPLATERIV